MVSTLETPQLGTGAVDPMLPTVCRIQHVRIDTHDTFTLDLAFDRGTKPFRSAPGQFNMLYHFGVGEVPVSISSDPNSPLLQHTIRAVGPVTKAMRLLKPADSIGVRGPFGSAWPLTEATGRDLVIVAGGLGLAPLRSVICRVLAEREKFANVFVLYGARGPAEILYRDELEQWRDRPDLQVRVTVDHAGPDWRGNVGIVTTLLSRAAFNPSAALAMICGPEVMMRFTVRELHNRGIPPERIYVSMERNMKCAIGFCGHCQFGPTFICKDGPVFRLDRIAPIFGKAEI